MIQGKAPRDEKANAVSFIPMYQPVSANGRRLLKPRPKPYDQWTEEEWKAYDAHISEVRSRAGRKGGHGSHKMSARGRYKQTAAAMHREDYEVLLEYSRAHDVSIPMLLHELAERLKAEAKAEQAGQPQQ